MAAIQSEMEGINGTIGRCDGLFEKVLVVFTDTTENHYQVILDYQRRFQAWAKSLGAFGTSRAPSSSLPQPTPGPSVLILKLLKTVELNLARVLASEDQQLEPGSLQSWLQHNLKQVPGRLALAKGPRAETSIKPSSQASLSAIESSIARLEMLTATILENSETDTGAGSELEKSTSHYENSSETTEALVIEGRLRSRFPKTSELLAKWLVRTIKARKARMIHQRHHNKSVESSALVSGLTITASQSNYPPDLTNADTLGQAIPERQWLAPLPPVPHFGAKTVRCDWCLGHVSVSNSLDLKWWRRHTLTDLEPYVCLSGCTDVSPSTFRSFNEWADHMKTVHTQKWATELLNSELWYCDIDPCKLEIFGTVIELTTHIDSAHGNQVSSTQVESMTRRNIMPPAPEPYICPICYVDILTTTVAEHDQSEARLHKHHPTKQDEQESLSLEQKLEALSVSDPVQNLDREVVGQGAMAEHIATHLIELAQSFLSEQLLEDEGPPPSSQSSVPVLEDDASQKANPGTHMSKISVTSILSHVDDAAAEARPVKPDIGFPDASSTSSSGFSTGGAEDALRDSIWDSLCRSEFDDDRSFVPRGSLQKLITPETIDAVLEENHVLNTMRATELRSFILQEARVLFIILVVVEVDLVSALNGLRRFGLTDQFLPIPQSVLRAHRRSRQEEGSDYNPALRAFHRRPWTPARREHFYEQQWKFLAPIFTPEKPDANVAPRTILPFVKLGPNRKTGLFSTVYKVEIHADHQSVMTQWEGEPAPAALKEVRTDSDVAEIRRMWENEARAWKEIRNFHHTHLVTPVASILRGSQKLLLFDWADGGDLREFWETDIWPLTKSLILEVISQLLGLSRGLLQLHRGNCRHGDLKPENILIFRDSTTIGVLKFGDMGSSKTHRQSTGFRDDRTSTRVGTLRYEPPEAMTAEDKPRSRRYDIWSVGCIMLEFVIWLVHGPKGLRRFNNESWRFDSSSNAFYLVTRKPDGTTGTDVHPVVKRWLEHMLDSVSWVRNTALGDLLELTRRHLLVVNLPSSGSTTVEASDFMPNKDLNESTGDRADAETLVTLLERIYERSIEDPSYLFPIEAKQQSYRPKGPTSFNSEVPVLSTTSMPPDGLMVPGSMADNPIVEKEGFVPADMELILDNDFAGTFLRTFNLPEPLHSEYPLLCSSCSKITLSSSEFAGTYSISYLDNNARLGRCDLCTVFRHSCVQSDLLLPGRDPSVTFVRDGSTLKLFRDGPPVLSVIGHLVTTASMRSPVKYMALSHIHGPPSQNKHLEWLRRENVVQLEQGVPVCELTAIFRDTAMITHRLGIAHMWIDSLCIIHDELDDGKAEYENMEHIFSNSYCTIAACSVPAATDGLFETSQRQRRAVPVMTNDGSVFSVAEFIDSFQNHVENSPLYSRAWAFQARIFSRRTIFFTPTQTYFQCGDGIRCGTLTKMRSRGSTFFSDPDFPSLSLKHLSPTQLYEQIYERYSRLRHAVTSDRPLAIAAVETRLLRALDTTGGYGILKRHVGRSLLWRRGLGEQMVRIQFPPSHAIPSWSWMAWTGGIEYLDLPSEGIKWEPIDIPFPTLPLQVTYSAENLPPRFVSKAYDFHIHARDSTDVTIIWDRDENDKIECQMCVVLGASMDETGQLVARYVLIVGKNKYQPGWERLGVGQIIGQEVLRETVAWIEIEII
ncbi:hypothetical protein BHE90_017145 [Fusarium euwallaceae]|uniref:Protein kinase domain-containing protein n=1 Tax=Fusarium euwallaceae TaxID=1147111 RepID=A0A430KYB6_9HYPO|nr:hypothetical protein BHE90_017145 [Fusarium euwallaceae]